MLVIALAFAFDLDLNLVLHFILFRDLILDLIMGFLLSGELFDWTKVALHVLLRGELSYPLLLELYEIEEVLVLGERCKIQRSIREIECLDEPEELLLEYSCAVDIRVVLELRIPILD